MSKTGKRAWIVFWLVFVGVLGAVLREDNQRLSIWHTFVELLHDSGGANRIGRCKDNLYHLLIYKAEWASNENKSTNDVPTLEDLRPYFDAAWSKKIPACPMGGSYSLNRVGEDPTCSIGGQDHSMAK